MVETLEEYGGVILAAGMGALLLTLLLDGIAIQNASFGGLLLQMLQGMGVVVA
jgi:hypothetical protein